MDKQVGNQQGFAKGEAPAGTDGSSGTAPSASGSDGTSSSGTPISVAAAIAVNVSSSTAAAYLPGALVITAHGPFLLASSNATTGTATGDGSAVNTSSSGSGTGVAIGAAVAINYDPAINEAIIGQGATVNAQGLTI